MASWLLGTHGIVKVATRCTIQPILHFRAVYAHLHRLSDVQRDILMPAFVLAAQIET
jgi:hypothetical protein